MESWRPSATIEILKRRAECIALIRLFFAKKNILEVETPLLSHSTVTDPHINSIPASLKEIGIEKTKRLYLQTSPEYAMKRLLAAGCGPIYQITKAFRDDAPGKRHNPEFTLLEWYRPGYDHHALMDEMDEFLQEIAGVPKACRMSMSQVFNQYLHIDPHRATIKEWQDCAKAHHIEIISPLSETNFWLELLFTHKIEPHLGKERPLFIYDFPVSQAALAKIRDGSPSVASRFEVYFKGVELANGFHECQNSKEQRKRFEHNLHQRKKYNMPLVEIDERLLAALKEGLPNCAGVALGIDRLMMLMFNLDNVAQVISFAYEEA